VLELEMDKMFFSHASVVLYKVSFSDCCMRGSSADVLNFTVSYF